MERYDKIGQGYDETRKADPYLTGRLLHHLSPNKKSTYLDIGCGTGNYTNELQKAGYNFIGVDPSVEMLKSAKERNSRVQWICASSEQTGLQSNFINGIIASLTIHHWNGLKKAFIELNRILKNNGIIVIFTSTPKQMKGYWLNHYFPKMLKDSMAQMPSFENVKDSLINAGFTLIGTEKYSVKSELEDKFLYCGKHEPELYLNTEIRRGISSFSSLANAFEIDSGLRQLKKDIASKKIHQIINSYTNSSGDYSFIIAKKHSIIEKV